MSRDMNSMQRFEAALNHQGADYVPISLFGGIFETHFVPGMDVIKYGSSGLNMAKAHIAFHEAIGTDTIYCLSDMGIIAQGYGTRMQLPTAPDIWMGLGKFPIKSPADWAGRSLGITDTGSSTDFLTQYITTKSGVDPAAATRRGVGAGQTFLAALQQKAIDCGMTTEPTASQAVASGDAYILLDMRNSTGAQTVLGGEYPATSLYMTTDYVNSHKNLVQKLVNAYVATLAWIQGHTGAQIADMMPASYYAGVGKNAYAKALDN